MVVESVFDQSGGFSAISSRIAWGPESGTSRRLALLGWLDSAPPEVRVASRTAGQQATALLYTHLSFDLPEEGDVTLPPGLIPGTLVEMPIEGGPCGPEGTSIWLGRGEAIFEFQVLDETQDIQVDELKLTVGTDGGGWWQPPNTALYDWDSGAWVALSDPIIGTNVVSNAARMVSEDGSVQVRLASDSNQGGCLYLGLGLKGRR